MIDQGTGEPSTWRYGAFSLTARTSPTGALVGAAALRALPMVPYTRSGRASSFSGRRARNAAMNVAAPKSQLVESAAIDPAALPARARRPRCAHSFAGPATTGRGGPPARPNASSYEEFFAGYESDPVALLERTSRRLTATTRSSWAPDIRLKATASTTWCRSSAAHMAYPLHRRVVGMGKLACVVEAYAKRLQIRGKTHRTGRQHDQRGVATTRRRRRYRSLHQCMTTR